MVPARWQKTWGCCCCRSLGQHQCLARGVLCRGRFGCVLGHKVILVGCLGWKVSKIRTRHKKQDTSWLPLCACLLCRLFGSDCLLTFREHQAIQKTQAGTVPGVLAFVGKGLFLSPHAPHPTLLCSSPHLPQGCCVLLELWLVSFFFPLCVAHGFSRSPFTNIPNATPFRRTLRHRSRCYSCLLLSLR